MRERIEALQATAMFGAVREETIVFLIERAKPRYVAAGSCFFTEGERGSSAFLLERGRVEVVKDWEGRPYLLRRLVAGDCFGEVALMDFGPRSATVRAEEDCEAIELTAADLRTLARRDAEQFAVIYMNLGRELSRRLRDADRRLFKARFQDQAEFADGYTFAAT